MKNDDNSKTGKFLGVPYDWRAPTWKRFKFRLWNKDEPRVIVPRAFGWGYDINVHALLSKFGLFRRG